MTEIDKLERALRKNRNAIIRLGAAEADEEARARQHAIVQAIRYACGVRDEVSRVCVDGFIVEAARAGDGAVQKNLVLAAANETVVGWVEALFGVTALWMDGWNAETFREMTGSAEIRGVAEVAKLPYQIGGMCAAVVLSGKCGGVEDYLLECRRDHIPDDLLAQLKPAKDMPSDKPCQFAIDPENPRRVIAVRKGKDAPVSFEKVFPVRIKHIRQSDEGQYIAVDILDFAWKIPLD